MGDDSAYVWRVEDGCRLLTLRSHRGAISQVRFSPARELLGAVAGLRSLLVWRVGDGNLLATVPGWEPEPSPEPDPDDPYPWCSDHHAILDFALSADGRLAVTGRCEYASWYTLPEGEFLAGRGVTNYAQYGDASGVAISPDSRLVAAAVYCARNMAGGVKVWRLTDGGREATVLHDMPEHWDLSGVAFNGDGTLLLVADYIEPPLRSLLAREWGDSFWSWDRAHLAYQVLSSREYPGYLPLWDPESIYRPEPTMRDPELPHNLRLGEPDFQVTGAGVHLAFSPGDAVGGVAAREHLHIFSVGTGQMLGTITAAGIIAGFAFVGDRVRILTAQGAVGDWAVPSESPAREPAVAPSGPQRRSFEELTEAVGRYDRDALRAMAAIARNRQDPGRGDAIEALGGPARGGSMMAIRALSAIALSRDDFKQRDALGQLRPRGLDPNPALILVQAQIARDPWAPHRTDAIVGLWASIGLSGNREVLQALTGREQPRYVGQEEARAAVIRLIEDEGRGEIAEALAAMARNGGDEDGEDAAEVLAALARDGHERSHWLLLGMVRDPSDPGGANARGALGTFAKAGWKPAIDELIRIARTRAHPHRDAAVEHLLVAANHLQQAAAEFIIGLVLDRQYPGRERLLRRLRPYGGKFHPVVTEALARIVSDRADELHGWAMGRLRWGPIPPIRPCSTLSSL